MIIGRITATWLTYIDSTDHKTTDVMTWILLCSHIMLVECYDEKTLYVSDGKIIVHNLLMLISVYLRVPLQHIYS